MMYRQGTMNGITIEQFAAFLDGNLSNDDMQIVSDAIDVNKDYSAILSDVMEVNDTTDVYSAQQDFLLSEMPGMDYDLPVLPISLDSQDTVELTPVNPAEPLTIEANNEDVSLTTASDTLETQGEPNIPHNQELHLPSSEDACVMAQVPEEPTDFIELT